MVSGESIYGGPETLPRQFSRAVYERGIFVGEDVEYSCRSQPRDGGLCDASGPTERSRLTRDAAGRIVRRVDAHFDESFAYDARGRMARHELIDGPHRQQVLFEYACPAR